MSEYELDKESLSNLYFFTSENWVKVSLLGLGNFFFDTILNGINYLQMLNNAVVTPLQQYFHVIIVYMQSEIVWENCLLTVSLPSAMTWNGQRDLTP